MADDESNDSFELPVSIDGKVQLFAARFMRWGYSYRIVVTVQGQEVSFEPDEERQFRAIVQGQNEMSITHALLSAIASSLEEQLR